MTDKSKFSIWANTTQSDTPKINLLSKNKNPIEINSQKNIMYDQKNDTPMRIDDDDMQALLNENYFELINETLNETLYDNSIKISSNKKKCDPQIKEYYKIIEVVNKSRKETIVKCQPCIVDPEDEYNTVRLKLEGLWSEVNIDPGDKCFISASYNYNQEIYEILDHNINNSHNSGKNFEILQNFIIIEPETMISPSRIKSAFPCYRRSIFKEHFKSIISNFENKEILIGSLIHELFQTVVRNCANSLDVISENYIQEIFSKIFKNYIFHMTIQNFDPKEIENLSKGYITNIIKFFKQFFVHKTAIDGIKINEYISSEKLFQSQVLGMKGVIDMIVETKNENNSLEITPLELKTGKWQNNEDLLQVLVYCLILSEQMGKNSYNGILLYLKKDSQIRIKLNKNDFINVIVVRNNIAKLMIKLSQNHDTYYNGLDELYKNKSECGKCFQKDICHFHYANFEKHLQLDPSKSDDDSEYNYLKSFIVDNDTQIYFGFFYNIINQEESFSFNKEKSEIKDGKIADLSNFVEYKIEKILEKENSFDIILYLKYDDYDFDEDDEIISQYVYINDGYHIYEPINKQSKIGVFVSKSDSRNCKLTINVLKHYVHKDKYKGSKCFIHDPQVKYLFLKNLNIVNSYTFRLMRGNLVNLCMNVKPKLKELIINHKQPIFNFENKSEIVNFLHKFYEKDFKNLNINQKSAILKALLCEDYTLIIGFPGSGKTTVIALIVSILVKRNKKVLLSAYTHTALDNILIKLKDKGINFVRIASKEMLVSNEIRQFVFNEKNFKTLDECQDYINVNLVYGVTTSGIISKAIINHEFDYCIIDEACQILEPCIIGPLLKCKKFILVGDPFQLPALLKGSETPPPSLFERLANKYPETSVQLDHQYRMNEEILTLSNACVYQNMIKCGNIEVSSKRLKIEIDNELFYRLSLPKYVYDILNPSSPVVFVDYMKNLIKNQPELLINHTDHNEFELEIIKKLIFALKELKFNLNDIGVLTPYKTQEKHLKSSLVEYDFFNVYTIDKSQGIEKEVIIISFVKNNTRTKILKDIARINVAFTRPKTKLIIVGLIEYLKVIDKLKNYMNLLINKEWVYQIDENEKIFL